MALGGRLRRYYINLGGTVGDIGAIRWGFRAPKDVYKNIGGDLGVFQVQDNDRSGIVYGANNPRPVRVRIRYLDAQPGGGEQNDILRSVVRFCEPDKLNDVLFGSINGKKVFVNGVDKEFDIESVTIVGQ
jgi:hypothetical protein